MARLPVPEDRFMPVCLTNDPNAFKGPEGSLHYRCSACGTTGRKLSLCSACRMVRYCSREHQAQHRSQHKADCHEAAELRRTIAEEEPRIRNATPDGHIPANAFETHIGRFAHLPHTRLYIQARTLLALHLIREGTLDGVQEALQHMQDVLRLHPDEGINMGLQEIVPITMLRLDRDQECYNFIKAQVFVGMDGTRDADPLEERPIFLLGRRHLLNLVMAALLLKIKLLIDIRNIKVVRRILARRLIPGELWREVELAVIQSPLSVKLCREPPSRLASTQKYLVKQACDLGVALIQANEHVVPGLMQPDESLSFHFDKSPRRYELGSWEQAAFSLQISFAAWGEIPGAIHLLNEMSKDGWADARAAFAEISDRISFRENPVRSPRKEKVLNQLWLHEMWHNLGWELKKAACLGPAPERIPRSDAESTCIDLLNTIHDSWVVPVCINPDDYSL